MSSDQPKKSRGTGFPLLAVLGGIVFILAGLAAYLHFETRFAIALIFVVAGLAVIVVTASGFKTHGWEVVIFVVGLIVLASVVGTNYYQVNYNSFSRTYSATHSQVNATEIVVLASSGLGSIDVGFSSNSDLAYQVTFTNTVFGVPFVNPGPTDNVLKNQTKNGVFYLNATSSISSITITLGMNYTTIINATASTGSIDLNRPENGVANIQRVSLITSTGSIDAQIESRNISAIVLKTGTGSVNLASNYLSPSSKEVPILVSSGTGSVDINAKISNSAAVLVNASSNLGSVSHHLSGFTISQSSNNRLAASAGNVGSADRSFLFKIEVGTGSADIGMDLVSQQ